MKDSHSNITLKAHLFLLDIFFISFQNLMWDFCLNIPEYFEN